MIGIFLFRGYPMAWTHARAAVCLVVVIAIFVGCTPGTDTTTVQGKISYNGQPVTSGLINFLPAGGQPLGGPIGSDGTYSFELPPGEYQVRIDAPPAIPEGWKEGDPPPKLGPRPVPEKYASYHTSGLTATVGGNKDPLSIDFHLL